MASSPTKVRAQGRAQSPGPVIAEDSSVTTAKIANVVQNKPAAQPAERTSARPQVLAKVLGLAGFLLICGLEWAAHCQHRSVELLLHRMTSSSNRNSSDSTHRTVGTGGECRWNENDQLDCGDRTTWIAEPSALCPGTRFDSVAESSSKSWYSPNKPDALNDVNSHTLELLEQKIGYSMHTQNLAKFAGCIAMVLCALVHFKPEKCGA